MGSVRVRGVGSVHGDVAIAPSRRKPTGSAKRGYEQAAIRLTFIFERQRSVSVRSAVCGFIPAPQVKTAGDSADRFDVDCALRVHSHAGLDGLPCSRGQTETFVGIVIRGSRTDVCRDSLTIRAVVLTGRVGRWRTHSYIDSDGAIGNSGRVELDSIPHNVSLAPLSNTHPAASRSDSSPLTHKQER